jgi:long-chain acyl-CoA synthetase
LLDIELQRFFAAIGIPIMQGYGLSEASPVISANTLKKHRFGSSGILVKHLDVTIRDGEGNILPMGEKGEIVIKGDNVMKGYWRNEVATAGTIKDGWLYTGDMGYLTKDGFLYVLGRFKSLLIGSDGEKYSPEGIEESMVELSPLIDQCMLYNNQNAYTSAFIVPNVPALKSALSAQGKDLSTDEGRSKALALIQDEINKFKTGGEYGEMFPDRWLPAAVVVLPEAFTEQNKMLNSTMKMVRGKVTDRYCKELDFLYTASAKNIDNEVNQEHLKAYIS